MQRCWSWWGDWEQRRAGETSRWLHFHGPQAPAVKSSGSSFLLWLPKEGNEKLGRQGGNGHCLGAGIKALKVLTGFSGEGAPASLPVVAGDFRQLPGEDHPTTWRKLEQLPWSNWQASSKAIVAPSCTPQVILQLGVEKHKVRGFSPYFRHLCTSQGLTGQIQCSLTLVLIL